jgi:tetratricopeptide (TPR) repeat protein
MYVNDAHARPRCDGIMQRKLVSGCLILLSVGGTALSAPLDDCRKKGAQPQDRVRACSQIISNSKSPTKIKALAYSFRGKARTDAGAYQQAIADFSQALLLQKDNVAAYAGRGRAQLFAGQAKGAIEDYDVAIRLSPKTAELYVERGHAQMVSGGVDAAIRDFDEALKINPHSWSAFNERGVAKSRKGQLAEAISDFDQAIAIRPLPEIYANRGYVNEALAKSQDAIRDLQKALQRDPSLVPAREALRQLGAEPRNTVETDQRVRRGAALAEKNCSPCHAIGVSDSSPNKAAPEFRTINQRRPLFWLRAPVSRSVFATHEKMPKFNLTSAELDSVIAYINSLPEAK